MRSALISLIACLLVLGCASPSQSGKPSPCGARLPSSASCSEDADAGSTVTRRVRLHKFNLSFHPTPRFNALAQQRSLP